MTVTQPGSLYSLVIPVDNSHDLWLNQSDNIWPCEYLSTNIVDIMDGLVHVRGTDCVAIEWPNGSLRLEIEYVGEESNGKQFIIKVTSLANGARKTSGGIFIPAYAIGLILPSNLKQRICWWTGNRFNGYSSMVN